jgi:hypothetical protein
MKARFPIGLEFDLRIGNGVIQKTKVIDVLTTSNSSGIVVEIKYLTTHIFCGCHVAEVMNDTKIARCLGNGYFL